MTGCDPPSSRVEIQTAAIIGRSVRAQGMTRFRTSDRGCARHSNSFKAAAKLLVFLAMKPSPSLEELLAAWRTGEQAAIDAIVVQLYDILHARVHHSLRSERNRDILETTDLLHDLYLKLRAIKTPSIQSPEHFMRTAEAVVRHTLVDIARKRGALRGGQNPRVVTLSAVELLAERSVEEQLLNVVTVHKALESIHQYDPNMAIHIGLRLFFGMTQSEIAEALGTSRSTVQREWPLAKRALLRELSALPTEDASHA
jgi:RNA polymerase sigma factor (TIGR02999 family)